MKLSSAEAFVGAASAAIDTCREFAGFAAEGRSYAIVLSLSICAVLSACDERGPASISDAPREDDVLQVIVSNYPLLYFTQRIGGAHVHATLAPPENEDPAFWKPVAADVIEMQRADLIVLNGAGYEQWLAGVSLQASKLVDTSQGSSDRLLEREDTTTHQHGPSGDHTHSGTAFTTWLDPTLAQAQARTIRDALMKLMPEGRADFTRNHDALTLALAALDQRFISITAPLEDRPLLYSHPVYQYFDSRYGLSGRALHLEPDQTVTRAQWLELRDVLAEHPATIMLWEAPPLDATKAQLEELGIEVVVFEPAGKRPDGLDFMQRQQANADNLRRAQTLSEPAQPKHTPK